MHVIEPLIVALAIAIALAYLLRKGYLWFRGNTTCGDCACGTKTDTRPANTPRSVSLTIAGRNPSSPTSRH